MILFKELIITCKSIKYIINKNIMIITNTKLRRTFQI